MECQSATAGLGETSAKTQGDARLDQATLVSPDQPGVPIFAERDERLAGDGGPGLSSPNASPNTRAALCRAGPTSPANLYSECQALPALATLPGDLEMR